MGPSTECLVLEFFGSKWFVGTEGGRDPVSTLLAAARHSDGTMTKYHVIKCRYTTRRWMIVQAYHSLLLPSSFTTLENKNFGVCIVSLLLPDLHRHDLFRGVVLAYNVFRGTSLVLKCFILSLFSSNWWHGLKWHWIGGMNSEWIIGSVPTELKRNIHGRQQHVHTSPAEPSMNDLRKS